jgi:hypothetical protein
MNKKYLIPIILLSFSALLFLAAVMMGVSNIGGPSVSPTVVSGTFRISLVVFIFGLLILVYLLASKFRK